MPLSLLALRGVAVVPWQPPPRRQGPRASGSHVPAPSGRRKPSQATESATSSSAASAATSSSSSFPRRHRPPPRPAATTARTAEILAFFDAACYRGKNHTVILSLARKLREHLIRQGIESDESDDPSKGRRRRPSAAEADALLASALKIPRIDRAFRAMLSRVSFDAADGPSFGEEDGNDDPVDAALRLADLLPPRAEIRLALLDAAAKSKRTKCFDVAGVVKVAEACSALSRRLRNPEYGLSPEVADDAGAVAVLVASTRSLRAAKRTRERSLEEEEEEEEEGEERADEEESLTESLIRSTIELALSRHSSSPAVLSSALVALVELGEAPAAFSTYSQFRRLCRSPPETRTFHALLRAARCLSSSPSRVGDGDGDGDGGRSAALKVRRVYDRLRRGLHGPRALPNERTAALALSAAAAAGERDVGWILAVYSSGVEAFGDGGSEVSSSYDSSAAIDAAAALALAFRSAGAPPEASAAAFAAGAAVRLQQQQQHNSLSLSERNRQSVSWLHAELLQLAAASGEPERAVALWTAASEDGVTSLFFGNGGEGEEVEGGGGGGSGETSSSSTPSSAAASVFSPAYLFSALFKCVAAGGGSPELQLLGDAARSELRAAWLLQQERKRKDRSKRSKKKEGKNRPSPPHSSLTRRDALVAHNAALAALAAGARVAEARALLDSMTDSASGRGSGPAPDAVSFNCVLDAAAQAGDVDAAFDAYRAMIEEGERRRSHFAPGVESYGALMHAAARAASPADAELVLRAMRAAGVEASVQVFTSYMAALVAGYSSSSSGDSESEKPSPSSASAHGPASSSASEAASAVLAQMRAEGLSPTAVTFGVCLQAAEQSGDVGAALRFYSDALKSGVAPTDECHSKLLRVASSAGHSSAAKAPSRASSERTLNEVLGVVRRLVAGGGSKGGRTPLPAALPTTAPEVRDATLNSLARALASSGQLPRASRILTLLRSVGGVPETPTLGAMLRAAAAGARLDDAEFFYEELRSRGVRARRRDASTLVVALCDAGRLGDALRIYADLARPDAHFVPPSPTVSPYPPSYSTGVAAAVTTTADKDSKKPPRVKPRSSERTRSSSREWGSGGGFGFGGGGGGGGAGGGSAGAPSAAAALVAALASGGDVDAARSLYLTSGLRESARRAYSVSSSGALPAPPPPAPRSPSSSPLYLPPPAGIERAWAALIEAACHASRPAVALLAFDDWRAAADAADAAGAKPPELSPALLAFLEATCRSEEGGGGRAGGKGDDDDFSLRVLDVCSALRTMTYRASQSALAAPPKASHHVRGWIEEEDEEVEKEEERRKRGMSVRVVPNDSVSDEGSSRSGCESEDEKEVPRPGSAAAAVAARRAALASPEVVAARRAAELVAARAALRKRLAERRRRLAAVVEQKVEVAATATVTATATATATPLPLPPPAPSTAPSDEGSELSRPRPAPPKLAADASLMKPRDRPDNDDDGDESSDEDGRGRTFDWSFSEGEEEEERFLLLL